MKTIIQTKVNLFILNGVSKGFLILDLDYLIVVDFECNSGTKGFVLNEIIEFPFVLIDINQCKIIKEYTSFVKPTYHKKLTNFIKNLTYIE